MNFSIPDYSTQTLQLFNHELGVEKSSVRKSNIKMFWISPLRSKHFNPDYSSPSLFNHELCNHELRVEKFALKLFGWGHPSFNPKLFKYRGWKSLCLNSQGWKSSGLKYPGLKCPTTLIKYLNTTSEQLKMLCANAIFRLAEEKESRHLVK